MIYPCSTNAIYLISNIDRCHSKTATFPYKYYTTKKHSQLAVTKKPILAAAPYRANCEDRLQTFYSLVSHRQRCAHLLCILSHIRIPGINRLDNSFIQADPQ